MFHKNALPAASSVRSIFPSQPTSDSTQTPRLSLVPSGGGAIPRKTASAFFDLVAISAHRCSAFFAEAAVLVLVLALLDRFMLKGHFESRWIVGAVTLSLMLLAASIATDFSARRWLQRR
jgi:general stress protein CsbA